MGEEKGWKPAKKNPIKIIKKLQMTWTIRGKALIVAKKRYIDLSFYALCENTCCQGLRSQSMEESLQVSIPFKDSSSYPSPLFFPLPRARDRG